MNVQDGYVRSSAIGIYCYCQVVSQSDCNYALFDGHLYCCSAVVAATNGAALQLFAVCIYHLHITHKCVCCVQHRTNKQTNKYICRYRNKEINKA